ncbi:retrovirus-related pol polyprotein from transposon TNT 1-94 [Tanacetum coccineum]
MKKSDATDCIMSFIKKMENLNEVRVNELRSDNGTKLMNHELEEFYDEKGISQNFSSPCNPEQNKVVNTACYTQNRSIIVKRHGKTAYDVFRGRSLDISYFYVFGYPMHIHNYRDHLGKFDEKDNDGFFLSYFLADKAFRFSIADDHPVHREPDVSVLADNSKLAETHIDVSESQNITISGIKPSRSIICPSVEVVQNIEEPNQFERNKVWTLVPVPYGETIIGTKWIFKNKMDKNEVFIKNKARLVAQGFKQEEEIDYDETFEPVVRLEAVRIFHAYAAYMGFMVYQMDVKSAFLNRKILEEVYVQQPPGFESSEFPNHVCKLDKALYALKEALSTWYETLSKFLIQHNFFRGFQIKLDFKRISICQEKFVKDLLKKYDLVDSALVKCPMLPPNNLEPDESGVSVNETLFKVMIRALMYLTASRPDIQFSICRCARYQDNPKESYLVAVKRIFKYLKGTLNLGLSYQKGSGFDLKAYSDLNHIGCNLDRKSSKYVLWKKMKEYTKNLSLNAEITQAESFSILVYCFSHNTAIRTPFDTILAATRREINYLQL